MVDVVDIYHLREIVCSFLLRKVFGINCCKVVKAIVGKRGRLKFKKLRLKPQCCAVSRIISLGVRNVTLDWQKRKTRYCQVTGWLGRGWEEIVSIDE